ncbi:hypothetical protein MKW94_009690 [Papaver nudicaule]|uniref:t-SNARE coiled-coil homology domain-containing protein n=1 Tax=Papaver nudicaule TaxID=74823 RepID=A0AA42ASG1_PAPNU|nr:hypothetical protein [Papaver nudicaule]
MNFKVLKNGGAQSCSSPSSSQNPSQAVASGIFQINTVVSHFRRLVNAVGTIKDTPEHRQKLHNTRQRIGQLVKETSSKLKAPSDSDHSSGVNPNKTIEDAKIARDFQAALQDYQQIQQLAAERESAYDPYVSLSSLPTRFESECFLVTHVYVSQVLMLENEVSNMEAVTDERDQGLRDVQSDIAEQLEIFRDVFVYLHNQGGASDDIASHLDSTVAVTSNSKTHLYRAINSMKSRSSWCWWMLLIFILVLVIVLLYLVL